MRDRTNFEQLSPVEKARLCLPDVPLSDAMAANLALQLEFASTWREVAGTKIQKLLLKRIANQAGKLSDLVSQVKGDTLTYLTYESDACLPPMDRISSDLKRFSEQARRASSHKGGIASVKPLRAGTSAAPRGMFGRPPDYVFVICLADIYLKYTGRQPGVCRGHDQVTRVEYDGLFVDFVEAVCLHFCGGAKRPSGDATQEALLVWKKRRNSR